MNELLRDQFEKLGVKYEQATWDADKQGLGQAEEKRHMSEPTSTRKPPFTGAMCSTTSCRSAAASTSSWPTRRGRCSSRRPRSSSPSTPSVVSKNKMTIKEFEKEQAKLLQDKADARGVAGL
jgi:hypothetical protein